MVLITYQCVSTKYNKEMLGYSFENSPEEFIERTQNYPLGEHYFILNVLPVSEDFYKKWKGKLKGE